MRFDDDPCCRFAKRFELPSLGLGSGCGLASDSNRFNPAVLFANGEQGLLYEIGPSTCFVDVGRTTPAAVGDTVAGIADRSGRSNHASQSTSASRPILRQDGSGNYYLEYDGVDDYFVTASVDFSNTDKITAWVGIRKSIDTPAFGTIFENNSGGQAVRMFAPGAGGTASFYFSMSGGSTTSFNATNLIPYTAPMTAVLSCHHDLAGAARATQLFPRVNGSIPSTLTGADSGTAGSGNFQNQSFYIGRRDGASLPFNGRLYGLILRSGASSAEQILATERWLASRTGIVF